MGCHRIGHVDDLGNIHLDELVEGLDLVADQLPTIRLRDEGLKDVTITGEGIHREVIGYSFWQIRLSNFADLMRIL